MDIEYYFAEGENPTGKNSPAAEPAPRAKSKAE
jgi:hypothetical protein